MNSGIESKIIISVTADTKNAINQLKELKKMIADINTMNVSKIKSLSTKVKPQNLINTKNVTKATKEISKAYDEINKKSVENGLPKNLSSIPNTAINIKENAKASKKIINMQEAVAKSAQKTSTALNPLVNKNDTDNWQKNFFTTREEPTKAENIRAKANMIPDTNVVIREGTKENSETRAKWSLKNSENSIASARKRILGEQRNKEEIEKRMALAQRVNMITTNQDVTSMQKFSEKVNALKSPMKNVAKSFGRNTVGFFKAIKAYRKVHNIKGLGILPSKVPHTGIPKLMGQIGRIAMYRLFRVIIKGITAAIQTGFSTMATYDSKVKTILSEFTSEMNYLKNTMAALAYNVFEAIKPQLTQIIEFAIAQFNTMSIAIAQLMGKSTYKKAVNVWKDFGTTVAASFDELNILTPDTTTENPFEDVELPDNSEATLLEVKMKSILTLASLVGLKFASFGTALKIGGILLIIDSLKDNFSELYKNSESFKSSLDSLTGTIKSILPDLLNGMNRVSTLISNMFDEHEKEIVLFSTTLNETIIKIINFVKRAINGIFNYIENSDSIKKFITSINSLLTTGFSIIGKIVDILSVTFVDSAEEISLVFDTIFDTLSSITEEINKILEPISSFLSKNKEMISGILKPVLTIVSSVLQLLSPIIELLGYLVSIYLDVLSPSLEALGKILSVYLNIVSLLVGVLSPIIKYIFDALASLVKIVLYPILKVFELIFSVIKNIATWLGSKIPNSLFAGLSVTKFIKEMSSDISEIVEDWTSGVDTFFGNIENWINKIPDWIKNAYKAVTEKVGDWFDKVASVGEDAWNFTKGVFTGQTFASGGFVDSGTAFIAGESGAEMVGNIDGRTGVMNESQITSAFAEALVNTGYLNQQSDNQSTPEFNIYLDSKKIASAVEKANYNKSTSFYKNGIKGSNF